jgi:hypothetical protein
VGRELLLFFEGFLVLFGRVVRHLQISAMAVPAPPGKIFLRLGLPAVLTGPIIASE